MKKRDLIALLLFVPAVVFAEPGNPPTGGPGMPPGDNSANIVFKGANVLSGNTIEEGKTYSSSSGGENTILMESGKNELNKCKLEKSGDSNDENADFYGTNAAILVKSGTLSISGSSVKTNALHANGIFAYADGNIFISGTQIITSANNSGGIMVAGGGTITASNCTVKTSGNSSAAIRSDRGGGNLTVNQGTYESSGMGSPAVYSTANIVVNNAELTSTSAEGIVVEGKNSVTLNNSTLTDTNTTLNGNSETYKNIFLYQSMSGDAENDNETAASTFTAKRSEITTNKGDTFFVTNTNALIDLESNTITNNDGDFLRIQKGKWGKDGENGGNVTLNLTNQEVKGNIVIDNISTLDATIEDGSIMAGSINSENQAKEVTLNLSSDSVLSLTSDTYITSLKNETKDNSNIYSNGKYKLYVNKKEIPINSSSYGDKTNSTKENSVAKTNANYVYIFTLILLLLTLTILILLNKKRKKTRKRPQ